MRALSEIGRLMTDNNTIKDLILDNVQQEGYAEVTQNDGDVYIGAELIGEPGNYRIKELKEVIAPLKYDDDSEKRHDAVEEGAEHFGRGPHWSIDAGDDGDWIFSFKAPRRRGFLTLKSIGDIDLPEDEDNDFTLMLEAMEAAGLHYQIEERESVGAKILPSRLQYLDKTTPEEVADCYSKLVDQGLTPRIDSQGINFGPDKVSLNLKPWMISLSDRQLGQLEAWAEQYTEIDLAGD